MRYTEAKQGRIFILRLEHHDRIPDVIEEYAKEKGVKAGLVHLLGGAEGGSRVIVGPTDGEAENIEPIVTRLQGASEAVGTGTLFLNESGEYKLHLHAAFGRDGNTVTGCTRKGVDIWYIGEVIIIELLTDRALRMVDKEIGFELLTIKEDGES